MLNKRAWVAAASAIAVTAATIDVASAACTRLAFSVNDYGKEGPIRDAKNLLDKYIAKWTAERGIKNYKTGPKAVSCELFIDVIVFDEYTCKAEATVCWGGPLPKGHETEAGAPTPSVNNAAKSGAPRPKAAPKPAADGSAPASPAATPISTGSVRAAPAATRAPDAAPAAAPKAQPAAVEPARPSAPPAAPAAPAAPASPAAPPAN